MPPCGCHTTCTPGYAALALPRPMVSHAVTVGVQRQFERCFKGRSNTDTFAKQACFLAGGTYVATGCDTGHLVTWEVATGAKISTKRAGGPPFLVTFSCRIPCCVAGLLFGLQCRSPTPPANREQTDASSIVSSQILTCHFSPPRVSTMRSACGVRAPRARGRLNMFQITSTIFSTWTQILP